MGNQCTPPRAAAQAVLKHPLTCGYTAGLVSYKQIVYHSSMTQELIDLVPDEEKRRYDLSFYNPIDYHREMKAVGEYQSAWDSGLLVRRRIDPVQWGQIHFGGLPWKVYALGSQGVREYVPSCKDMKSPKAVYPVWDAMRDSWATLEDYVDDPWGKNLDYCTDKSLDKMMRPVWGQAHKIFITGTGSKVMADKAILVELNNLQVERPEVEFVLHDSGSFSTMFGMAFRACTYGPRMRSAGGHLVLPSGKVIIGREFYVAWDKELKALGWDHMNLFESPSERCKFNIFTARQAAIGWDTHQRIAKVKPRNWVAKWGESVAQPEDLPLVNGMPYIPVATREPGDMLACDHCSVWRMCSKYREGSVCTVAGSEGKSLADHFKTGNSALIVEGLRSILEVKANRVDQALESEKFSGDANDPNIDKMLTSLFKDGVTLAKLVDPSLRAPLIQQNFNGGGQPGQIIDTGDARALASHVISEIEATGVPRDAITEAMVDQWLQNHMQTALPAPVDAEIVPE